MVGCAGDTNMDEKKPNNSASAYALALASYPEMAPYPNEMEYFDEKTGEFDSDGFDVVYDAWQLWARIWPSIWQIRDGMFRYIIVRFREWKKGWWNVL
jgi:hypothetical protein